MIDPSAHSSQSRTLDKAIVVAALEALDRKVRLRRWFGITQAVYRLNPPASIEEVVAFERKHNITLPADYRAFITEIGNGAPCLFPFGMEQFRGSDYTRNFETDGFAGDISQPFPHAEAWNLPESELEQPEIPDDVTDEEAERLEAQWYEHMGQTYCSMTHLNGAIPISDHGCGWFVYLVVNGDEKGKVWNDDRANNRGIFPACDGDGRHMEFTDWYFSALESRAEFLEKWNRPKTGRERVDALITGFTRLPLYVVVMPVILCFLLLEKLGVISPAFTSSSQDPHE